jgi:FAD dependent oxidoreductase/S-layer homology domain
MSVAGLLDDSAFLRPDDGQVLQFPILVVGGSTAAYTAALGALQAGATVCIVQPQKVLGGQFTAQALPASDDAPLMAPKPLIPADQRDPHQLENGELFCISRAQRQFRDRQRQLQPVAGRVIHNPGGSWVSHFSVTPVTAAIALNQGIESFLQEGKLTLIPLAEPVQVMLQETTGEYRRVTGAVFQDLENGRSFTVHGEIVIEATDLGDLLELGNIESRVGQESRSETGEAILPDEPQPLCQQAFTFCAVVEKSSSGQPIPAPLGYGVDPWLDPQSFPSTFWIKEQTGWEGRTFFDSMGVFRYRRLQRSIEDSEVHDQDVSVMNWGTSPLGPDAPKGCGNDYLFGAVLTGVSRQERQQVAARGRDRAQAYLHCLQTTAAPDLAPRGDLTWTADGIALEPYIREARRGVALTTVRHEDVASKFFPGAARAHSFEDAIGIGQYHYLDFHPNEATGHVDLGQDGNRSLPFTIPLGALIPLRTDGFILSAKSIGTTHITNAAYRMHPIEWAIGEAGGHLAAFALSQGVQVREVAKDRRLKRQFQGHLARFGIPLFWFNDISHEDADFEAIQVLAAAGIVRSESAAHLNFNPQAVVSRAAAAIALVNILGLEPGNPTKPTFVDVPTDHFAYSSIEVLYAQSIVKGIGRNRFAPERSLTRAQLASLMDQTIPMANNEPISDLPKDRQPVLRRELSRVLYRLLQAKMGNDGLRDRSS